LFEEEAMIDVKKSVTRCVRLYIALMCLVGAFAWFSESLYGEEDESPPLELKKPEPVTHKVTSQAEIKVLRRLGDILLKADEHKMAAACYYAFLEKNPADYQAIYNLACAHALMKQIDEALYWLQEAARLGLLDTDWAKKDTDLEEVRKDTRFDKIIIYGEKRREATKDNRAKPYNVIYGPPEKPKEGVKFPVIVWLHGRGSNPDLVVEDLKKMTERYGVVIVSPAGPGIFGPGSFNWDPGFDKSLERIEEALNEAEKKYPIDRNRLITSGFSQGASVSMEVFMRYPERVLGSIVFCPLGLPVPSAEKIPDGVKDKIMLVAWEGTEKPMRDRFQDAFREKGGLCVVHSVYGMGHTLPPDYANYFESWFLLILESARKPLQEELQKANATFAAVLPESMQITKAEVGELEGKKCLILQASAKEEKAEPVVTLCLWPLSASEECPYHKSGTHNFILLGKTGAYEVYYSGPEGDLKDRIMKGFSVKKPN
jgi:predicted esterase